MCISRAVYLLFAKGFFSKRIDILSGEKEGCKFGVIEGLEVKSAGKK